MDKLTPVERSRVMSKVRGKNTSPEIRVRRTLHALGYRFRLHKKDLPGKPDIVIPKYRICIFVHGCFWHQHSGCKRATIPVNNHEFWVQKFADNACRDEHAVKELMTLGWQVMRVWECQTKKAEELTRLLRSCLPFSSTKSDKL
jgi:DNA mismatch endonuclease (patch repair protein)